MFVQHEKTNKKRYLQLTINQYFHVVRVTYKELLDIVSRFTRTNNKTITMKTICDGFDLLSMKIVP